MSTQVMSEWMRERSEGIKGTAANDHQVVSTCIAFVTLCSVSSISSRQTIVTRVPRNTRVPLPACVLWVHVPCADSSGKQEPPDPHGSDDRAELKEGSTDQKGEPLSRGPWHSLCSSPLVRPAQIVRWVTVEAGSRPSCLQPEHCPWKGHVWLAPILMVSNPGESQVPSQGTSFYHATLGNHLSEPQKMSMPTYLRELLPKPNLVTMGMKAHYKQDSQLELAFDAAIPLLGIYAKALTAGSPAPSSPPMFTVASLTVVERWKINVWMKSGLSMLWNVT